MLDVNVEQCSIYRRKTVTLTLNCINLVEQHRGIDKAKAHTDYIPKAGLSKVKLKPAKYFANRIITFIEIKIADAGQVSLDLINKKRTM